MASDYYNLEVEYNEISDEYYIILPKKLLKDIGWGAGDKIKWIYNKDGTFTLRKIK